MAAVSAPSQEEITAGQFASEAPTAAYQRLVFEELAGVADYVESFAICLKEAARRDDRVRAHGYICDLVRCVANARGAYARIAALAGLEARK
jgi:hypothetical protein